VERALQAHVAAHPQGKHGRHEYSLQEFGLDADTVRTRLAGYIDRFALPCDL
jgi:hypothetical protein